MTPVLSTVHKNRPTSWMISIYIAVALFVTGQICLRKSFMGNTDYRGVSIAFGVAVGVAAIGFLVLGGGRTKLFTDHAFNIQLAFAIAAGFLFFIGNFFWIRGISSNAPLGNIRVVMAGAETVALFLTGFLFFKEVITTRQLLGTGLIISGIHVFGSD